ncbi:unnamed protein product [Linum trigynum]|uniref:Uncharacterized protein n=1 Tax=Linum trigynum TaxID=586398 RepID=A0AAV2E1X2_9ROSI
MQYGWDFFDRSLIEKLTEVKNRNAKFIDDGYDDTTESPEEEEEEEMGSGYDIFSTDEESEALEFELILETASTKSEPAGRGSFLERRLMVRD